MKTFRKVLSSVLVSGLVLTSVGSVGIGASAVEEKQSGKGYTVTKVSNPDRGQGEIDGLLAGGNRENSYTWRMAQLGDCIYIATARNIANEIVNLYSGSFAAKGISEEELWAMINAVTNGEIPSEGTDQGAAIISYNRKTGEFEVVYTADKGDYFRMAVTFGDCVYFGTYSAYPDHPQYILRLDQNGEFTKVFETIGSVSLRATCEYDGHLFFGGADAREELDEGDEGATKMAILRKSNEDDTVWERVADYHDFGDIAFDSIMSSWAGAPVWELASHDGYIYATAPSTNGFVIFRGRPANSDEDSNEYGWVWEEVAGTNNGINNPGLSEQTGGEPGTMRSLIGSVYEFNGDLYAYNFDHAFGGEAAAFVGELSELKGDVKASDYLFYTYNSLKNPQKLWKLNDETGKFEECEEFTKLMKNTSNEYVWRAGQYDGQMYISTMDAGVFYNYITQLTNGSFFKMTISEKKSKIEYINNLIALIAKEKKDKTAAELKEKLESFKTFLKNFDPKAHITEKTLEMINDLKNAIDSLEKNIDKYNALITDKISDVISDYILAKFDAADNDPDFKELAFFKNYVSEKAIKIVSDTAAKLKDKLDPEKLKEEIKTKVKLIVTIAELKILEKYYEIKNLIDWEGIEMYRYINQVVIADDWGFDLYRTSDGESFEAITTDGFGDKYNYGCPSFLETEEGLYIGTCNPFYGGQLYLLQNDLTSTSHLTEEVIAPGQKTRVVFDTKGGVAPYTHTVKYKSISSDKWTTVTKNSKKTSVGFAPAEKGMYTVEVTTTDGSGKTVVETLGLIVASFLVNKTTINAETVKVGEKVVLKGAASGGAGGYKYAFYYKKSKNSEWLPITDEFTTKSIALRPGKAVSYDFKSVVKDSDGVTAAKTFTVNVTA